MPPIKLSTVGSTAPDVGMIRPYRVSVQLIRGERDIRFGVIGNCPVLDAGGSVNTVVPRDPLTQEPLNDGEVSWSSWSA